MGRITSVSGLNPEHSAAGGIETICRTVDRVEELKNRECLSIGRALSEELLKYLCDWTNYFGLIRPPPSPTNESIGISRAKQSTRIISGICVFYQFGNGRNQYTIIALGGGVFPDRGGGGLWPFVYLLDNDHE